MNKYNVLYILDVDLPADTKTALVSKFEELVVSLGGTVESTKIKEKQAFAYPINYKKFGDYVLMYFDADANAPKEIERVMKITDGIVRYMVSRVA